VLCVDEKSLAQALDRFHPVLSTCQRNAPISASGMAPRILFAAFSVIHGTVVSSVHQRHRAVKLKKSLTKIDAELASHATPTGYNWLTQVKNGSPASPSQILRLSGL
jgi:hypothetical protein